LVILFVGGLLIGLGAWLVLFVESIRAVVYLTPDARGLLAHWLFAVLLGS